MQPEQHLRKAEARIVDREPVVASERDLKSAAEAKAVDHGDGRQRQPVEPVHDAMAARQQRFDLRDVGHAAELRNVGAGDEAARLRRADHQPARALAFEFVEHRVELGKHFGGERVRTGVLLVEQEPGDAVFVRAQAPIRPRSGLLCRFIDRERAELEVALAENGQSGFCGG